MKPEIAAASVAAGDAQDRSTKRVRGESASVYGTEGQRFESCRARCRKRLCAAKLRSEWHDLRTTGWERVGTRMIAAQP
jgi:hypothetical protein